MSVYLYPNRKGNLANIALKIEKLIRLPDGLGRIGDIQIIIWFNIDLSSADKTKLDNFMSDINCGQIPANTGNTTFLIKDIDTNRAIWQNTIGEICIIYHTAEGYEMQFNKPLSAQAKKTVKDSWTNLLTEKI